MSKVSDKEVVDLIDKYGVSDLKVNEDGTTICTINTRKSFKANPKIVDIFYRDILLKLREDIDEILEGLEV